MVMEDISLHCDSFSTSHFLNTAIVPTNKQKILS